MTSHRFAPAAATVLSGSASLITFLSAKWAEDKPLAYWGLLVVAFVLGTLAAVAFNRWLLAAQNDQQDAADAVAELSRRNLASIRPNHPFAHPPGNPADAVLALPDTFAKENQMSRITDFAVGDKVNAFGRTYAGPCVVEKIDLDEGKVFVGVGAKDSDERRYISFGTGDLAAGKLVKPQQAAPQQNLLYQGAVATKAPPQVLHQFRANEAVQVKGRLFSGQGRVLAVEGGEIVVRAGNGKKYRYTPDDVAAGVLSPVPQVAAGGNAPVIAEAPRPTIQVAAGTPIRIVVGENVVTITVDKAK